MRYTILSCISSLLLSSVVYAADCVTSFDNSCFPPSSEQSPLNDSEEDRPQPVEESRNRAEERARAVERVEQARADAQVELDDLALQQRAYEQSVIANQLQGGFELSSDAVRGLSAEETRIARERMHVETPALLIARSREALARQQAEVLDRLRQRVQ